MHRFPDLTICMAHGADPWWDVAIRLMIKWKGLHVMTSAYSPKRLPDELIHFMNTHPFRFILASRSRCRKPLNMI